MKITYAPRDVLQIDGAKIIFRNFSGEASKFNARGNRDFSVVIPDEETVDRLIDLGWNVKKKEYDDDRPTLYYLKVKVKFTEHGPDVYLNTNGNVTELDEESISCLDDIYIVEDGVDLDIRPYDWEVNGKTGRTAYLKHMHVTQDTTRGLNRFAARYQDEL